MTREQATEFAYKDEEHNDKYGPAYAVPVAEKGETYEKKWKVKVPARDEHSTRGPAEKAAREQFTFSPGQSAAFKIDKVTKIKEGKLPEMTIEKGGAEGFKLVGPGTNAEMSGWSKGKTFTSRSEAVAGLKAFILGNRPQSGSKYEIVRFKTTDTFTIGDTTKSLHLFEVEGHVTVSKNTGKIIGWIFYGIAPS